MRGNHSPWPPAVITGAGVICSLGAGLDTMRQALQAGRSGLRPLSSLAELGIGAPIGALVDDNDLDAPGRKLGRFLCPPAHYAWQACSEALERAALPAAMVASPHCQLIVGAGAALSEHERALHSFQQRGAGRLSPFILPRGMSSASAAALAYAFKVGGCSYTIHAACCSSTLAIGQAMDAIALGKAEVVIVAGSEELHPSTALWFDAMGALSQQGSVDDPQRSRPYQRQRDGFYLGAGAGALIIESADHAAARGATIWAHLAGFGAGTDASQFSAPSATGIAAAIEQALFGTSLPPDYINTHACGSVAGDLAEWTALQTVFANRQQAVPPMSSIKALTGHTVAASGVLDLIACLLMLKHGFIAAGSGTDDLDPAFATAPLLPASRAARVDRVLSTSFGFGGGAAAVLLQAPNP